MGSGKEPSGGPLQAGVRAESVNRGGGTFGGFTHLPPGRCRLHSTVAPVQQGTRERGLEGSGASCQKLEDAGRSAPTPTAHGGGGEGAGGLGGCGGDGGDGGGLGGVGGMGGGGHPMKPVTCAREAAILRLWQAHTLSQRNESLFLGTGKATRQHVRCCSRQKLVLSTESMGRGCSLAARVMMRELHKSSGPSLLAHARSRHVPAVVHVRSAMSCLVSSTAAPALRLLTHTPLTPFGPCFSPSHPAPDEPT